MARRERIDRQLEMRLDEFEKRIFVLKIEYEKYFSGLTPIEPLRDRDDLKRFLRELQREHISTTRQKHRLRTLRARFSTMEMYWQRNLIMVERGTHPKMKFRADAKERARATTGAAAPARPKRLTDAEREDKAYRAVFDKYLEARDKCGQGKELAYESVREVLRKQVRTIKSRYRCKSVRFRVTVEDGKAKVKAVPVR